MSKFGGFLGRKAEAESADNAPANNVPDNVERLPLRAEAGETEPIAAIINGKDLDIDDELFSPLAIQLHHSDCVRTMTSPLLRFRDTAAKPPPMTGTKIFALASSVTGTSEGRKNASR